MAVVIFLAIVSAAGLGGAHVDDSSLVLEITKLFALETVGGAVFGLLAIRLVVAEQ